MRNGLGAGLEIVVSEDASALGQEVAEVFAEWLAFPARRSPAAPSHRIVNASWGFRLAVARPDRNSP
jgi:hypothetical protein